MKPRIFIGSSGKAKKYAEAIHANLTDVAECTVWTQGAFGLSASTLSNLSKNLHDSDFGAFVFAADDQLSTHGDLLDGRFLHDEYQRLLGECTPRKPLGATMVSSEGACAAYYNYGRFHGISEAAQ